MTSCRTGSARLARGFTILELVVVLAVLTLVATFSIRAWFERSEVTLQNAAELLAADLRELQVRATVHRVPVEVVFDPDGGGYRGHQLGRAEDVQALRRYPQDAVFEDVRIAAVRVVSGGSIVFDAVGRPASDASVTLESRGETRTVLVDADHARVTVE